MLTLKRLAILLLFIPHVAAAQRVASRLPAVQPAVNWLTPEDDWLNALTAGGTVHLGPGDFNVTEQLHLTRDVQVIGSGTLETYLRFDSDGGEFAEQLAIYSPLGFTVAVGMQDVTLMHGGSYSSDLITLAGPVALDLRGTGIAMAFDDPAAVLSSEDSVWFGTGILVMDGARLRAEDTVFYGNIQGVAAFGAAEVTVSKSMFSQNWLTGIYAVDSPLTVTDTVFSTNGIGIEVYGTSPRSFSGNMFADQTVIDVVDEE